MSSKILYRLVMSALLLGLAACSASNNQAAPQSPSGGTLSNGVSKGHPGETS